VSEVCEHGGLKRKCDICRLEAENGELVGLLRRIRAEIDAGGEGIPMSADTWEEMDDVLQANIEKGGENESNADYL